uniref:Uncharacterized protein n=1 Tax=Panagrolaimus davidi TaxID=227884 RepID=A0A914R2V9_9BILA
MLSLLLIAIIAFVPCLTAGADPPQLCTSIRATKIDEYFGTGYNTIRVSMNLTIFKFGDQTWISVGKVDYTSDDGRIPDYICANVPFDINVPDPQKCSPNLGTTFAFSLQEPYFYLHGHFNGYWDEIFFGYADDGTFSNSDGTLMTPAQPTYSTTFSNRNSNIVDTQNCTSFTSAPIAPKAPRCKSFESKTEILNSDNSTYATSIGNYNFIGGNNINAKANFTGPSDFFVIFWVNGSPCER